LRGVGGVVSGIQILKGSASGFFTGLGIEKGEKPIQIYTGPTLFLDGAF
jgi:hypothetical protein